MVDWYRHDIVAWMDGTDGLSERAYRAYHTILQLIYLHEGPVTYNERVLARRCNQHVNRFRAAMSELILAEKLEIHEGKVDNTRAQLEINRVVTNRIHAGNGGRSPRDTRNKSLKRNGGGGAMLHDFGAYKRREDERSEE